MAGDRQQRFCESCQRTVHDLSTLTRKQAEHLLAASPHGLCGRIACDETGKMIFRPEPERAVRRMLRVSLLGVSAWAADACASADVGSCSVQVRVVDLANAAVADAHVSLSRTDQSGPPHEGLTDSTGTVDQQLDAGRYRLQIERSGFATYAREVDLACGNESPTRIDAQLQIGIMSQFVQVVPPPANPFVRGWY